MVLGQFDFLKKSSRVGRVRQVGVKFLCFTSSISDN